MAHVPQQQTGRYRVKTHYGFTSESQLSALLVDACRRAGHQTTVAILAGHFILDFDPPARKLVPLIPTAAEGLEARAELVAGRFPIASFNLGIVLFKTLRTQSLGSKIALLADDNNIRLNQDDVLLRKELRRDWYRSQQIPDCFLTLLQASHLTPEEVFLRNDDPARNESAAILPRTNVFFSETYLQKRSKPRIKKLLEVGALELKNDCVIHTDARNRELCVTGPGQTSCLSTGLELLLEFLELGFSIIVLLTPDACFTPLNEAAKVFCSTSARPATVFCVRGLNHVTDTYTVNVHSNSMLREDTSF